MQSTLCQMKLEILHNTFQKVFEHIETIDNLDCKKKRKAQLALYTDMFNVCTSYSFTPKQLFKIFFKYFGDWISTQKHILVRLELPWPLIFEKMSLKELGRMQLINTDFNNGIPLTQIIMKLKILNIIMAYFNRTSMQSWSVQELIPGYETVFDYGLCLLGN